MTETAQNKLRILVADDSRVILKAFNKILGNEYDIVQARDGEEAWDQIQQDDLICAVFTDMNMPNMGGLELLTHIRNAEDSAIKSLPVILVTSSEDDDVTVREAFTLGITVLINKPFDTLMLTSCARAHVKPRHLAEVEEEHTAIINPDTNIANKAYFRDRGEKDRAFSIRQGLSMSVALIGLNNYTDFSNTYPQHKKALLLKVCRYVRALIRQEDTLAYLGAGQIGLIIVSADHDSTMELMQRIRAQINSKIFTSGDISVPLAVSVGLATASGSQDTSFMALLNEAHVNFTNDRKKKYTHKPLATKLPEEITKDKHLSMLTAMLERANTLLQQRTEKLSPVQADHLLLKVAPLIKVYSQSLDISSDELLSRLGKHLQ